MLKKLYLRFFRGNLEPTRYQIIARYSNGYWFKQFEVEAYGSYEACRFFDTSDCFQEWTRVSGATIK